MVLCHRSGGRSRTSAVCRCGDVIRESMKGVLSVCLKVKPAFSSLQHPVLLRLRLSQAPSGGGAVLSGFNKPLALDTLRTFARGICRANTDGAWSLKPLLRVPVSLYLHTSVRTHCGRGWVGLSSGGPPAFSGSYSLLLRSPRGRDPVPAEWTPGLGALSSAAACGLFPGVTKLASFAASRIGKYSFPPSFSPSHP